MHHTEREREWGRGMGESDGGVGYVVGETVVAASIAMAKHQSAANCA